MNCFKKSLNGRQIKALLRKDAIVRFRQPWMIVLQIAWPIAIFLALYTFRYRFQSKVEPDCQFPTRLLPSDNNLLPFFHSYICTIENQCLSVDKYEDYTTFNEAPLKPVLNIIQTFLNEKSLYNAIYELPTKMNFITAVTTIATHSKFSYMESNIQDIIKRVPQIEEMIGSNFDIKKLFSDSMTFSRSGKLICGRPFPRNDNIRFVNDILESEDFSDINDDELEAMPTKYCKKLYLDITNTNNGKITWSAIKPIIQGKIIYGPTNNETMDIMKLANTTYDDMRRLQDLAQSLNTILIKLRNDEKFKTGFMKLLEMARSPVIQMALGGSVDIKMIELIMSRLMTDQMIFDIVETVKNILECFSVDRFITINDENEMQNIAHELHKKNLFYAGIYFNETNDKNIVYKIKVEPDNTPITLEPKNRFWFPGPDASMELDLKYHRGFVQIKHSIDFGIIKYKKKLKNDAEMELKRNETEAEEKSKNSWWLEWDDDDEDDNSTTTLTPSETSSTTISPSTESDNTTDSSSITSFDDENTTTISPDDEVLHREKRQLDDLFGLLFGGSKKKDNEAKINVQDVQVYTKQFPYPSYIKDDFKKGLYLAQAVQMAFFVALLIQIATCIRYRIWMKESKNTMLMRSMGLKGSSEVMTWIITTFIEITIVFLIACIILYSGGIVQHTGFIFLFLFLTLFGLCMISFCFLCSTIFSSASTGCVSSVILFLMTFMPYIIIISLDTKLSDIVMFIVNLSFSTSFCYAWDYIMRLELQGVGLTFSQAFNDGFDSEFTYAASLIILDLILYSVIGYVIENLKNDEYKFHSVPREDLDISIGATIQNASKIYDMKIAVSNISLTFPKNEITCLLGRNGAGKSTIIKMLTGQIEPSSGKVILSQALADENQSDRIGLCSQDNILIPNLTAREHLEMYARIKLKHGIHSEVMRIMRNLNFGKYENYEAYKLSGGYQRRLCVAIAFIGSPSVVILDEPCSGVDTKARKCVWELIETLKMGRAVILATHYLDEAEYLSDSVIILSEGKIIAQHTPDTLKTLFTKAFEINIIPKMNKNNILEEIRSDLNKYLKNYNILEYSVNHLKLSIPYDNGADGAYSEQQQQQQQHNPVAFIESLEKYENDNKIHDITISSKNLEEIFNNLNDRIEHNNGSGNTIKKTFEDKYEKIDLQQHHHQNQNDIILPPLSRFEMIKILLWKRAIHFRRNYRLLLCILILPVVFEIIAMGFMQLRPGGEYERMLNLTKYELYPDSVEFLTLENGTEFLNNTYNLLNHDCENCMIMSNTERAFRWILDTNDMYPNNRYGGLTFNDSYSIVWYNNKGYHSMVSWLNDLNTHLLQAEMNDTEYRISTLNHPIKLGERELTYSSILQQVADAGVSLIILIAFSLVIAGASVYIVNERIRGERLQQKLCGVDYQTYWSVAFFWDFLILLIAILLCVIVFESFAIPVYIAKSNLNAICLLLVLFGFAMIPAVHIFEKLFSEASFANMAIFCLNVVIALTTLTVILMIDILGESEESVKWKNFLNRAFLVFPQHALSDGLLQICRNFIVAEVFSKFDIDSYKSPISSDLLRPHYMSLIILGIIFMAINYAIESGLIRKIVKKILDKNDSNYELKIVSIQNSLKRDEKYQNGTNGTYNHHSQQQYFDNSYALKVENLYKSYKRNDYAVNNVSFKVNIGECFGLLGNNGAGKSTIFKILSGQLSPTSGNVFYTKKGISYCPQSSSLDPLLTVEESIKFYGKLRRISDIENLITKKLKTFHLDTYKNILVKNLSGGNRRKLNVAAACLGDASLVLMDEPTSDMDPVTRSLVYQAISKLISEQRSILMTSHTISEIDSVCNRIGVLKDGKLISTGTPDELNERFGGFYIVTIFHNKSDTVHFEMDIKNKFPQCKDVQSHAHSVKFVVKVKTNVKPITINNEIITDDKNNSLSLSELFEKLKSFCNQHSTKFTIVRCRLDKIFEKILDSSEFSDGSYIHRGYIQTETTVA